MHTIECILESIWPQLARGAKVDVPASNVEHPRYRPDLFRPPPGALPVGQSCDYVLRLRDGGRIHAQCFTVQGRETVRFHLDRWDPERSAGDWISHALFETPLLPMVGLAAVGIFLLSNVRS